MEKYSSLEPDYLDEESKKNIEDYICCICQLIPNYNSALEEINCGHLFCGDCLTKWLKKDNKCPFCKAKVATRKVEKDNKIAYRFLINLIVKCQEEKCNWKGPWNELDNHLKKEHFKNKNDINKNVLFVEGECYKSTIHNHKLKYLGKTSNSWKCDGTKFGKCQSGITDFNQTSDITQFTCKECNFNLCEKCMRYYYDSGNIDYPTQELLNQNQIQIQNNNNEHGENNVFEINKFYLSKVHKHLLKFLGVSNENWFCDGRSLPEKCYCGKNDYETRRDIPRFRCQECDFDLCLECMKNHIILGQNYIINNKYTCSEHKHPMVYMGITHDRWYCNGKSFNRKCFSGITGFDQTENIPRFRCDQCDFDFCINCFDYYSNVEKNNCIIF